MFHCAQQSKNFSRSYSREENDNDEQAEDEEKEVAYEKSLDFC